MLGVTDIKGGRGAVNNEEFQIAPLVWWDVKRHLDGTDAKEGLEQYAVLGHKLSEATLGHFTSLSSSTRSHLGPLSCALPKDLGSHIRLLENYLLDDPGIGKTPHPLAGLILHYDGPRGTEVCEAAFLCSRVKTTVLVSASNYGNLKVRYEEMAKKHGGSIEVKKLLIATKHLDTKRVKILVAVAKNGESPLYIQVSGGVVWYRKVC